MIKIEKIWIENTEEFSRCCCDISVDQDKRNVWFQVDREYGQYLCAERADAYVVGLLNWAMRENQNIISEIPVTEELLYNINTILIPSLSRYGKSLHNIKVEAPHGETLVCGDYVGTGCSCGVDSFSAIKNHINTSYTEHNLTHLCINNVGSFNECYEDYGIEKVRKDRYQAADAVAMELNLPIVKTDSNFAEVFPQNHYLSNTYSGCFAIYALQKMWKTYYLASVGLDYSKFSIINNDTEDSAHYDLLTLQCFSTSGLRIYSEGGEKTRLEKTKDIADMEIARRYLHVCVRKTFNCGTCTKCRRTLLTLDLLDKLDDFSAVFDIKYYKENKKEYYEWLCCQHYHGDEMNEPVYQGLYKRKEFRDMIRIKKADQELKRIVRKGLHITG